MADQDFADLQKAFFAAFIQGLGYSVNQPAQVVQPAPPIVGDDDDEADEILWSYLNTIPAFSLTRNTTLSSGVDFLTNYSAVMASLQSPPNNFESTVGPVCFEAYMTAIENGVAEPSPEGFRSWATYSRACSAVANSGASALAAAELDPIYRAQMRVRAYKPAGKKPADFFPGYATMMKQLKKAPSRTFDITLSASSADIKNTWTGGSQSAVFGLWRNSSSTSTISKKFASSKVHLKASFKNLLPFKSTPGDWYTSSAFGIAYSNKGTPPWKKKEESFKTWDDTFGPDGNMLRYTTQLLIANQMTLNYTTEASFSTSEQVEIKKSSSAGLWPFYNQSNGSTSYTEVDFGTAGEMNVTVTTEKNVATIVGCVIEPVDAYLGHTQAASQILMSRLFPGT